MRTPRPLAAVPAALLVLAVAASPARAQCANLGGPGCGILSPPSISCTGAPTVGNATFKVTTSFFAPPPPGPYPAVLLIGLCAAAPPSVSFPSLCSGGAPCITSVFVDLGGFFTVGGISPGFLQPVHFPLPIENDPAFVGVTLCAQAISLSYYLSGASCVAVTNGLSITFLP